MQGGREQHAVAPDSLPLLLTWRCWLGTEVQRPPEEADFGPQKLLGKALNPYSEPACLNGPCATRPHVHSLPQSAGGLYTG